MSARERIIGIDLGTTNSAAAIMEAGRPTIIPSERSVQRPTTTSGPTPRSRRRTAKASA